MWTSELSPYLKNSAASRMLIAIIPAERYIIHPDNAVNLTLQTACHAISESFNRLSEIGTPIVDPYTGEEVTLAESLANFLCVRYIDTI